MVPRKGRGITYYSSWQVMSYHPYNIFFKGSVEEEEVDEDEDEKAARLHRIRVEAGKKAAATRKAHAQQQQVSFLIRDY